MIPVRAQTTDPITCLGGIRNISSNHPLADLLCPVCDESVDMRPVTLVLVGFRPDDRAEAKTWSTGGTVVVHADCAGFDPEANEQAQDPDDVTAAMNVLRAAVADPTRCRHQQDLHVCIRKPHTAGDHLDAHGWEWSA